MSYGLSPRAPIADSSIEPAVRMHSKRSTASSWRTLDAEGRLALIERALKPANDLIDAYPMAL